jgi:Protein of unknown function (DUF1217)
VLSTFTSYNLISSDLPKALARVAKEPVVDNDTRYYLANIGKVKTVEQFVGNDRLFRYAMKAYGLEDMTYAKAFMIKALKEGVDDPDSFANRLSDKRYATFVSAFNFAKYGERATTYNRAQVDAPKNFATQVTLGALSQGFDYYGDETEYYLTHISQVKSIDDLMGDSRLLMYAMAGFGLDSTTEPSAKVRAMLEGGVSDPNSPANKLTDKSWANFVATFNFVENGAQTTSTTAVLNSVPDKYVKGSGSLLVRPNADYIDAEAAYFKANISKVKTVTDLLGNERLLSFAMSAYGLDSTTETRKDIRTMLEGGVQDPNSPANKSADKHWANFVAAFDFQQYGNQATSRDAVLKDTPLLWTGKSSVGLIKPGADYVKAETAYYQANVSNLHSIDDLMANKRLLNFALYAYGLDPATQTPQTIRQMLEGGVTDPNSPANKLKDKRYAAFVTAFNFAQYGEQTTTITAAQKPSVDKYVRQTLEEEAGQTNEGVQLALYFQRQASSSSITSWYSVLADRALAKVVYTVLGLPDSFAQADIDKQVAYFDSKLKLSDFTDPAKLGTFLKRFTAVWETQNVTSSAQTSVSVLFGQPAEFGISTDLLLTMQKMKF